MAFLNTQHIRFLIFIVHFLFAQKTNQKRAPKMPTSACLGACYTSLIGATKQAAVDFVELTELKSYQEIGKVVRSVRTIFGFALAPML